MLGKGYLAGFKHAGRLKSCGEVFTMKCILEAAGTGDATGSWYIPLP